MSESITAKIKKLLALGTNNTNENEAKAALSKAYKLMALHDINVNDSQDDNDYGELIFKVFKGNRYMSQESGLITMLLDEYFNVTCLFRKQSLTRTGKMKKFSISAYGRKDRLETAKGVYEFLYATFQRLYSERKLIQKDLHRKSFYRGLLMSLSANLDKMKETLNDEYGLVMIEDPKITEFNKTVKQKTTRSNLHIPSVMDGVSSGKDIYIHRNINND